MKLKVNQTQTLKLNTKMIQNLKILEMNSFELDKYILDEVSTNPLLLFNSKIPYRNNDDFINVASDTSIKDDLLYQLNTSNIDNKIGMYIIESLDDRGYFTNDINSSIKILNTTLSKFLKTLKQIQQFEPVGIASTSLKECLKTQVMLHKDNKILLKAIDNLELFGLGYFDKLSNILNIPKVEVENIFKTIKSLNPIPLNGYVKQAQTLIPEIFVKVIDDKVVFKLDDYSKLIVIDDSIKTDDKETLKYLKEKRKLANKLLNACQRRTLTLTIIVETIFKLQEDFFLESKINVLTLKTISELTSFHISTIHRAIKNKAFEFNNQTYPLSVLFTTGVNDISQSDIKKLVKEIINNEDKTKPLSDQKISEILLLKNIEVSRRTISKYRKSLRILSTIKRKIV